MILDTLLKHYPNISKKFIIIFFLNLVKNVEEKSPIALEMLNVIYLWVENKATEYDIVNVVKDHFDCKFKDECYYYMALSCLNESERCIRFCLHRLPIVCNLSENEILDKLFNEIDQLTDLEKVLYK